MRPTEWIPDAGTHDAPTGPEEAEALELGGRVAIFRCYQPLLFDDPPTTPDGGRHQPGPPP